MVVKIQPAAANITGAVIYNENKMSAAEGMLDNAEAMLYEDAGNTGHIVATRNVPDTSTLENEFERLRWKNERVGRGRKLENPTFHMSVNPGALDRPLSEEDITAFTDELMQQLGYGDSPYRIFRHDDTGRTHYHIVSTRIGQNGKKVSDSFENHRCENICRSLAAKYGFFYGLQESDKTEEQDEETARQQTPSKDAPEINSFAPKTSDNIKTVQDTDKKKKEPSGASKKTKEYIPPFSRDSDIPASEQYRTFHREAMGWAFTTPEQYASILRIRYNTKVELYGENDEGLQYTGLGTTGAAATTPVTEQELGITALDDVLQRCSATDMKKRRAQRKRLEDLAVWAAERSDTWSDFRSLMQRKGVYTVVAWSREGKPFGVTWLDRATRCAWKGSETAADLAWLLKTAEDKGWNLIPAKGKTARSAAPAKDGDGKRARATGRPAHNLAEYSSPSTLQKLLAKRGHADRTQRSEADASRSRSEIKYGREDDNDITI